MGLGRLAETGNMARRLAQVRGSTCELIPEPQLHLDDIGIWGRRRGGAIIDSLSAAGWRRFPVPNLRCLPDLNQSDLAAFDAA